MTYTVRNFRTKKALKEAVQAHAEGRSPGVGVFEPGPFGGTAPRDGTVYLEGPHYPAPHTWYAQATLRDGYVVKVK